MPSCRTLTYKAVYTVQTDAIMLTGAWWTLVNVNLTAAPLKAVQKMPYIYSKTCNEGTFKKCAHKFKFKFKITLVQRKCNFDNWTSVLSSQVSLHIIISGSRVINKIIIAKKIIGSYILLQSGNIFIEELYNLWSTINQMKQQLTPDGMNNCNYWLRRYRSRCWDKVVTDTPVYHQYTVPQSTPPNTYS